MTKHFFEPDYKQQETLSVICVHCGRAAEHPVHRIEPREKLSAQDLDESLMGCGCSLLFALVLGILFWGFWRAIA